MFWFTEVRLSQVDRLSSSLIKKLDHCNLPRFKHLQSMIRRFQNLDDRIRWAGSC